MLKCTLVFLALVLFTIGAIGQNPPTLRVVAEDPSLPADLYFF